MKKVAAIVGVVLVGGRSTRMRRDKGLLDYHGMPQREFVYQMLHELCLEVYCSCRQDQLEELNALDFKTIPDRYGDKGPMGGLLSVFEDDPWTAKLVVAVDLPFLDHKTLQFLVKSRNPNAVATAFRNPVDYKPDPLLTIWEPRSYPLIKRALKEDRLSPREILIQSGVTLLQSPDKAAIRSIDSERGYKETVKHLKENSGSINPD